MTRKFAPIDPLPPGRYIVTARESIAHGEVASWNTNGTAQAALCVSDGKWCTFFVNGAEVWGCNAHYAAAHFDTAPAEADDVTV
ncbi:hypothetical protein CURE108131_19245 [Cupriavidus respiraculi]|uniref:Uncharacterized protein n=1 Tax=Cupriavidus respiraculi TaxID=195930 RepID=A0ABM8XUC0_9BURK|nr:hypothetical protein [Cupriavidus respiraculi]CAG9183947.1 hypothetical protein LMG21510_04985 [Cupriavidus respiraculi]